MLKKIFVWTLLFGIFCIHKNNVNAVNIFYPKSDNVVINSDKTFFIGNNNPALNLKINNEVVNIHPTGGFKHTVKLDYGQNKFIISDDKESKIYTITRPKANISPICEKKIINYQYPIIMKISDDDTPLRSTPVDSGLNRLQHLQRGITLNVIGEYENFFKIKLSRDDIAWVSKNNLKNIEQCTKNYGIVENIDTYFDNDKQIYKFKLNTKVPYVLNEEGLSGYTLTLYDMNNSFYDFGKYEYKILQDGKNFGYWTYYNDKNELIVEKRNYPRRIEGIRITIDAGHGGKELGAVGCLGTKEKDINLLIAKKLKSKLEDEGAIVYMTRSNDEFLGLNDRVKFSNDNDSQIFISLHNNALSDNLADKDASGSEVYYFYPQSRYLAKVVASELTKETGLKNRGSKGGSFAVIRNSKSLAILVESAFMINPEENAKLINSDFQDKIADGIVNGLKKYFEGIDMELVKGK